MENHRQDWLKLDNAAKIYPASSSRKSPAQFRLSVSMKENICYNALYAAWVAMLERCPYFRVHLKKGFFWYYLQQHQQIPPIRLIHNIPNIFDINSVDEDLIQIKIRENVIALDFSHIITDGNGSMRFFMGLIYEYLRQLGYSVTNQPHIPQPGKEIPVEEIEDAHRKYFPGNLPQPEKLSAAYHLPGKPATDYQFIEGEMPLAEVLRLTREYNVSLTTYLAAKYIDCLRILAKQNLSSNSVLPVRLQVPVDMRRVYHSSTMRNFSLFVSPEIDLKLGDYDFKEIIEKVNLSLKMQINPKEMARQISRNVGGELNLFVRIVPRFLKNLYLSSLNSRLGERCYSGVLSNLGYIEVTESAQPYINSFEIMVLPNHQIKKACAAYSYDEKLFVSFCSVITNRDLERCFFTHFTQKGIKVILRER
jgi:hypothetical protein